MVARGKPVSVRLFKVMLEKTVLEKEGRESLQGHLVSRTQAPKKLLSLEKQPHLSPIQLKSCLSLVSAFLWL